jgi:hypothetical protein
VSESAEEEGAIEAKMPRVLPVEDADPPRLCDEAKSSRSAAGVSGSKQYGERDAPVSGVREEGEVEVSAYSTN